MEITIATETKVTPIKDTKFGLRLQLPVKDCRILPIPDVDSAKLGVCFIRVLDIPGSLDRFMAINPRVPNRAASGLLTGAVVKGILETLRDTPQEMAIKNRGINLLVDKMVCYQDANTLYITFTDPNKHGIIDGGHTYSAIRESIETASPEELESLKNAYVRLNIYQGIDESLVPEIAEGLNRSKQVDDPSLVNLQGEFDIIRKALQGKINGNTIAYHQGDVGEVYISEILVQLELFNPIRFNDRKHPNTLYNKQGLGLRYFQEDMRTAKPLMKQLIAKLPEFLWLSDTIKKMTPDAAKKNQFQFGRSKIGATRAGGAANREILLPFIGEKVNYRVSNGWVFPMLAAFRANLRIKRDGTLEWILPLNEILPEVITELVGVCVNEHRDKNLRPDLIGKKESAYNQCYTKVQLHLAKKHLLG